MKKILTALLATALMISAPMCLFAEEAETPNPQTGQVDLIASKSSTYYLQIPKNVDVSESGKTFDILIKGDVDSAKQLAINEDKGEQGTTVNYLVDTADSNNKVAISTTVSDPVIGANITSAYLAKITFTVTHDALSAGSYTCGMPIKISLQNKA